MATSKVQTGLRVSENLYYKAKAIAEVENRSLNNLVETALKKYVADYESKNGVISVDSLEP